jgi:aminomethyltransferase
MPESLLRTPLYDWHVAHGGRMVEFGGWEMPVQYTGIVEEHHAVRNAVGLFDISHMGRISIHGDGARFYVNGLLTFPPGTLKPGQVRYCLICREDGGILDDVLVYSHENISHYSLVVNASNRLKILDWMNAAVPLYHVKLDDRTLETAMLALQGPRAVELLQPLTRADLSSLKYYTGCEAEVDGVAVYLSRTGYTGEDGFEMISSADAARSLADRMVASGAKPCGLGARDTLRLEAAMPLYGHELTEQIDPITAGLTFAVKLDYDRDFIGKAALAEIAQRTDRRVRVGLKLAGRRIAREGCGVYVGDTQVGEVTSGTFSPTLQTPIAMAYVSQTHAAVGAAVEIDVRGKREAANVVALPFYKRK